MVHQDGVLWRQFFFFFPCIPHDLMVFGTRLSDFFFFFPLVRIKVITNATASGSTTVPWICTDSCLHDWIEICSSNSESLCSSHRNFMLCPLNPLRLRSQQQRYCVLILNVINYITYVMLTRGACYICHAEGKCFAVKYRSVMIHQA